MKENMPLGEELENFWNYLLKCITRISAKRQ